MLSSTHFKARSEPIAFSIGSLVWGPILLSFSDWVIDKTIAAGSACILCLMREAEVFAPLIETRLKQRNVSNINVKKLYASRKSTFWPSINIESDTWFEDLLYILVQRRGYTVDDFYRDFLLKPDGMLQSHAEVLLRNADGLYYQGQNLLKQLTEVARKNSQTVKQNIAMQKELFIRYYAHNIGDNFENCTVVDLGNGGTIQHQIELILNTKSAANLLLYSSQRIYRYASTTHYRSFLDAKTDVRDLRLLFSRSPECIEPFLVGDCGTTLGYENDEVGSPIVADALVENSNSVQDFMCGVEKYFLTHYELGFGCIEIQQVIPILYRYIQFPTKDESALFTRIFHQDNFGSNVAYPIVTATQLKDVEQYGVANFHLEFCQNFKLKIGKIHWPQAIITLLSEKFLIKQSGFMSMDTDNNVLSLVERLETEKWTHFSVYGAGLFFEKLLPYIEKADLHVEFLIDRKAEVCDQYTVSGYEVISLDTALKKGCKRILISSFAYKDEISRIIYEQSQKSPQGIVEVLSL
ncbi:hypothetical protein RS130_19120 [Paraglaciecola aquimarina]|uniref:SIR2-like domain-containing protein n=1 Tax=Paraglaciecola aquimarina TaxID=1235557 RepID=A0ABU3T0B6_9ALTE|nr:hypothetical protein [Paraglaciecola aquimarina]MDU0355709.1 hypothetical protein [Paraglaciecola aquimarina]